MSPSSVWFITASSNGFGKQIALEALERGHTVVATARSTAKIDDLKQKGAITLQLDVTDSLENLKKIVEDAIAQVGRIDHLINAAGYILEGAVEEATPEETFKQFNTNVLGNLNVIRAVIPHMREQKSGVIALFGSLGSWRSGAAFAMYSSTKWACSGLAEGLRPELEPFGITVFVVEPGYFRTGFLNPGARLSTTPMSEYNGTLVSKTRQSLSEVDNKQPGDVVKGSRVIVDVMTKSGQAEGKEIPLRLTLGADVDGVIRQKCSDTISLLDEWKDITTKTDHDD